MDHFTMRDGALHAEEVDLRAVAERFGTPCYVYSRATLEEHWRAFSRAFDGQDHLVCFAVKACSNIAVLNLLARLGSGFDIVSGGELERVLAAGGDAGKVVFSGVGKSAVEIGRALEAGIHCFNVESAAELERIAEIAAAEGREAPVSLRVNPDVDARTHPYIATGLRENKFGIPMEEAESLALGITQQPSLRLLGLDCHIGSQLVSVEPFVDALDRLLALMDRLAHRGVTISHLNLGGGLGVRYSDETPPLPLDYAAAIGPRLRDRGVRLLIEPGRAIAANAGVLLTRVEYLKPTAHRRFAIVDAGMNDLMRPSLYGAWHDITAVEPRATGAVAEWDVVGPVCESADVLGKARALTLEQGDLLAVRSAGAYGFSMSSNYNSRPRPPEVLVDGGAMHLVRDRESTGDLMRGERIPG